MFFSDTHLSDATCFFWESGDNRYLVTNWHNVSGINPLTGKHVSPKLAEPNKIGFYGWENQDTTIRIQRHIPLENRAGNPVWLEHPDHKCAVDVVCIKLPREISPHVIPINTLPHGSFITNVADDVFILGYPMRVSVKTLPIWKRASVASEPKFDVDNLPKLLVDTASSCGMSGSPVISRTSAGQTDDGNLSMLPQSATRLVGIYSGRIIAGGSLEAQLGIVWKASVIEDIVGGEILGSREPIQ